jgi:hypothetical protein
MSSILIKFDLDSSNKLFKSIEVILSIGGLIVAALIGIEKTINELVGAYFLSILLDYFLS